MDIQSQVQKLLDDAVASGAQSACQCCVYDHGEKIVDAFAGSYEKGGERKIDSRSLFPICSTGKAFLATAGLRFLDRGLFALDDRISKIWPELAGDGKEEITFREVFGHRAGLVPEFPELSREEMSDWNAMARRCAEAKPIFPHGTRAAYLALTFTWYLGHPLTLLSGKSLKDIIRDEVLDPCGIADEAFFGGAGEADNRVVTVYDTPHGRDGVPPPSAVVDGTTTLPSRPPTFERMNHDCRVAACVPAGHAVASANAVASLFAHLPRLLSPATIREAGIPNGPPGHEGETTYGLGLRLWGPSDNRGRILAHSGFGGSEGWIDLDRDLAFGYTCACEATARRPPYDLRGRLYEIVGITPNIPRPLFRAKNDTIPR